MYSRDRGCICCAKAQIVTQIVTQIINGSMYSITFHTPCQSCKESNILCIRVSVNVYVELLVNDKSNSA